VSRTLLLALVLMAACRKQEPQSPYVRITADDGRLYYADQRNALHSSTGGFLAFRDLVTNESVRLQGGTYTAEPVPFGEVEEQRQRYMYNPSQLPRAKDKPQ
jgi:hypothetical protein